MENHIIQFKNEVVYAKNQKKVKFLNIDLFDQFKKYSE